MPIDLLAQSAALFCPYHFHKFDGAERVDLCNYDTFSPTLQYKTVKGRKPLYDNTLKQITASPIG